VLQSLAVVFLYSYNRPRVDVLIEILRRTLVASGLIPMSELECGAEMGIAGELGESIVWPINPAIAKRHRLDGSLTWPGLFGWLSDAQSRSVR
jgi:hypothetical protein